MTTDTRSSLMSRITEPWEFRVLLPWPIGGQSGNPAAASPEADRRDACTQTETRAIYCDRYRRRGHCNRPNCHFFPCRSTTPATCRC